MIRRETAAHHVGDDRGRTAGAIPGEHVVREVDADDRRDARSVEWCLADAGARTDVEHATVGQRDPRTRDELLRDRRVDERRALRPTGCCSVVVIASH